MVTSQKGKSPEAVLYDSLLSSVRDKMDDLWFARVLRYDYLRDYVRRYRQALVFRLVLKSLIVVLGIQLAITFASAK
jgi:hypothetical protein